MKMRLRPKPRPAKAATSNRAWGRGRQASGGLDVLDVGLGGRWEAALARLGVKPSLGCPRLLPVWELGHRRERPTERPKSWVRFRSACDLHRGLLRSETVTSSPQPGAWNEESISQDLLRPGSGTGWDQGGGRGRLFLETCARSGVGSLPLPSSLLVLPTHCALSPLLLSSAHPPQRESVTQGLTGRGRDSLHDSECVCKTQRWRLGERETERGTQGKGRQGAGGMERTGVCS